MCSEQLYVYIKKGNGAYAIDLRIINVYVISNFSWGIQLPVQLEGILQNCCWKHTSWQFIY